MVARMRSLPNRVHLLGAGGAGLSALARVLHARGHELSGHDRARSAMYDELARTGVLLVEGQSRPEHLPQGVELVVRSAAVPDDDPQVAAARERGVPVQKYAEVLGRIAPAGRALALAGTHGKTTSSWMLYHALSGLAALRAGEPAPSAIVGGLSRALDTNAVVGDPDGWFALEACEFDRSFHALSPFGAVVSNLEAEHLDCFGDLAGVEQAFAEFVARVSPDGLLVLGAEVPELVERACPARVWRLGRELHIEALELVHGCARFALRGPDFELPAIELAVPGEFNAFNAALVLGLAAGVSAATSTEECAALASGVHEYVGTKRRFERWGKSGGVELVHDYAHHPTEVRAVIGAARAVFPERVLHVLFQPHQESRTAHFLEEFADALETAERVVVTPVYGARVYTDDEPRAGARELARALDERGTDCVVGQTPAAALDALVDGAIPGSVVLVLGAGDIEDVQHELRHELALRGPAPSASRS